MSKFIKSSGRKTQNIMPINQNKLNILKSSPNKVELVREIEMPTKLELDKPEGLTEEKSIYKKKEHAIVQIDYANIYDVKEIVPENNPLTTPQPKLRFGNNYKI